MRAATIKISIDKSVANLRRPWIGKFLPASETMVETFPFYFWLSSFLCASVISKIHSLGPNLARTPKLEASCRETPGGLVVGANRSCGTATYGLDGRQLLLLSSDSAGGNSSFGF